MRTEKSSLGADAPDTSHRQRLPRASPRTTRPPRRRELRRRDPRGLGAPGQEAHRLQSPAAKTHDTNGPVSICKIRDLVPAGGEYGQRIAHRVEERQLFAVTRVHPPGSVPRAKPNRAVCRQSRRTALRDRNPQFSSRGGRSSRRAERARTNRQHEPRRCRPQDLHLGLGQRQFAGCVPHPAQFPGRYPTNARCRPPERRAEDCYPGP